MKRFVPKLSELIARYKIKWDKETIVNTDDDLTDRVFQAAVDLLAEAGAYCPETNRVMEFTRDEILLACSQAPTATSFGEDRERKTMYGRKPDTTDDRPWVHVGGGLYTTDESVYVDMVEKMASFNIVDSVSVPSILHLRGKDARVRSPQEILSACKTVRLAREGIRRSGRAGLPIINGISAASQPASMFAATHPAFGLRPATAFSSTSSPSRGGLRGPAEGRLLQQPEQQHRLHLHAALRRLRRRRRGRGRNGDLLHDHGQPDLPRQLPLQRAAAQQAAPLVHQAADLGDRHANAAIGRNMGYPMVNLPYLGGGSGTKQYHYEMACYMLAIVTSGGNVFSGHPAMAVQADSLVPDDHRFHAEMGLAAAKLTRAEAEPICQKLYPLFGDKLKDPDKGMTFQEVYDLKTKKIVNSAYQKAMDDVRAELAAMGLEVPVS